ncbi:MAG: hypothetical protein E4H36_12395 [Spirochaetales bacterium]|nr:MAG: hypothetical protein E4H36_12395 [Spirochaetales bacterium]
MKRNLFTFFLIFFLFINSYAFSDGSIVSLSFEPTLDIPVGESASYFGIAGGGLLFADVKIPPIPFLHARGGFGYGLYSIKNTPDLSQSVSLLKGGAGIGVDFLLLPWLGVSADVLGGYSYGFMNDPGNPASGGSPFISADAGLMFYPARNFSIRLGGGYDNYFGLFQGIHVFLGATYHIPAGPGKPAGVKAAVPVKAKVTPEPLNAAAPEKNGGTAPQFELVKIEFENIFPVFHKYYDDHPIARAVLTNNSDAPVSGVRVSLLIKQYMDAPKETDIPEEIKAGESREIELFALFTDRVLDITEATKTAAEIQVSYNQNGEAKQQKIIETIRIYDRNALTWDDDKKASAFVTAKDPAVLTFAKNVAGMVKSGERRAVNANLLTAIGIHDALSEYGMTYVVDPKSPYAEFSTRNSAVDFLQFPRQSLEYRAGDCDDLSILYSALLEAVGIETAFVTTPGHIFMAFSLNMNPDAARKEFLRADEFIFTNGKTWVPIEVTEREGGLLKAWQEGSKEWRENSARQQAGFFPVHDGWQLYEPVGLHWGDVRLNLPDRDKVLTAYNEEVDRFIDREIYPQVAKLQGELQQNASAEKIANKLGVLYARYGLMERAETEFKKALGQNNNLFALINLGNIYFMEKKMDQSLAFYNRAYEIEPGNKNVLLSLARVNHELENYGLVKKLYAELKQKDSNLALQFAYLDLRGEEASRAADISAVKELMLWLEE